MKFKTERKLNYIGVAIVFVIAFVLICVGVLLNSMHNIRVNNWLEVEGYIINIDHEEEKVFVSYLVDGKIYANQLDMYSSNLKENESISLLVSDKGKVYAYEFKVIYIILYISSAVTFITGLIIYFALRYKDQVIALCLRDGVKRKAIVDKITKSYQKNGTISSYRIISYYYPGSFYVEKS